MRAVNKIFESKYSEIYAMMLTDGENDFTLITCESSFEAAREKLESRANDKFANHTRSNVYYFSSIHKFLQGEIFEL